jgi:hypothetical protein
MDDLGGIYGLWIMNSMNIYSTTSQDPYLLGCEVKSSK